MNLEARRAKAERKRWKQKGVIGPIHSLHLREAAAVVQSKRCRLVPPPDERSTSEHEWRCVDLMSFCASARNVGYSTWALAPCCCWTSLQHLPPSCSTISTTRQVAKSPRALFAHRRDPPHSTAKRNKGDDSKYVKLESLFEEEHSHHGKATMQRNSSDDGH